MLTISKGMIRIIGGARKGRKLRTIGGSRLRPTTDRVREAIFDILGDRVRGASVLDLFAGTGAMGIEALSRGAIRAVFVESHRPMTRVIRENLEGGEGVRGTSRIIGADVRRALRILERAGERFDIVFLDPPYGRGMALGSLKELSKSPILNEDARVVVEHSVRDHLDDAVGCLGVADRRRYGDTQVSFYSGGGRLSAPGSPQTRGEKG